MYSDNIKNCEETHFFIKATRLSPLYSNKFKETLNNISKKEIMELLEEYDKNHICNFEKFYKDKNKHKSKGQINE
ncbi:hypothetical protein FCV38_10090 [Clostridium sporogenes]|nr:hypothetical protein [Clostridium sporogenes]